MTGGSGVLLVSNAGLVGSFTVSVALTLPADVDIIATSFTIQVNTTNAAVSESVVVAGDTIELELSAGPFVQVVALGAAFYVADQAEMTADVYFRTDGTDTFVGVKNFSVTINGDDVGDGEGAFLITAAGIAGYVTASVQVNTGAVTGGATGRIDINSTGVATGALSFVFDGSTFAIDLPAGTDGLYYHLSISDVSLNIGDFVTIEIGTGSWDATGAVDFSGVRIFLGVGPAYFGSDTPEVGDDSPNPNARGVLLSDASGSYTPDSGSGVYLSGQGTISILGIDGFTLSGTASVLVDTTGANDIRRITLDDTTITIGAQSLTGADLTFGKDGDRIVAGIAGANLSLGGGSFTLTSVNGGVVVDPAGVAGTLSAALGVNTAPFALGNARFEVAVNSGAAAVDTTVDVGGTPVVIDVPGGPYLRVAVVAIDPAQALTLTIDGQVFTGQFAFESSPTALRIAATGVSTVIKADTANALTITDGEGFVVVSGSDVAAVFGGSATLTVPGASLSATVQIELNTGPTDIMDTFTIGTRTVVIDVLGGPYLKVSADDVTLVAGGQSLRADLVIERLASTVTITVTNGALSFGNGTTTFLAASGINGVFTISDAAGVGQVTGDLVVVGLAITAPAGVDFSLSAPVVELSFDTATSSFRVKIGDATDPADLATLIISGQMLAAAVEARAATDAAGRRIVLFAVTDGSLALNDGNGAALVTISDIDGLLLTSAAGVAASFSAGMITANLGGLALGATSIEIDVNTTNAIVVESFGGQSISVEAGPFLRIRVEGLSITAAGQTFTATAVVTRRAGTVEIDATGVSATIGSPTGARLELRNGAGMFTISSLGVAGEVSGTVRLLGIPGVALNATMRVTFDTQAVTALVIEGDVELVVTPGGSGPGAVPAVELAGDFVITSTPDATGTQRLLAISIENATTFVGTPGVLGLSVTDGSFDLSLLASGDFALRAGGTVSVSGGGIDLSGVLNLEVNSSSAPIEVDGTNVVGGLIQVAIDHARIRGPPIGSLTIDQVIFEFGPGGDTYAFATGIELMVGSGATTLTITSADLALYLKTDGTHAFSISGTVDATLGSVDIDGTISIERNTTGQDVSLSTTATEPDPITLSVIAGVTRISATLTIVTPVGTITDGAFTIVVTAAPGADGVAGTADDIPELLIGGIVPSLSIGLGDPDAAGFVGLKVTDAELALLIRGSDVALDASGSVQLLGVDGVAVSGSAGLQFSTLATDVNRTVDVGGTSLTLAVEAGVTRFGGTGLTVAVAGQTITATFDVTIDDRLLIGDPSDDTVSVALTDVSFSIGDGSRPFVTLMNGTGSVVIEADSFEGSFSGDVMVDIPGVSFTGAVTVEVAETAAPAASYVRVLIGTPEDTATSTPAVPATLAIAGQSISGVFELEQVTVGGETFVRIAASEVAVDIAGVVSIAGGSADLVVLPTGVAGSISGTPTLVLPGGLANATGAVSVRINTTPTEIDLATYGGPALVLPAGPYTQIAITGGMFDLALPGLTVAVSGDLTFEQQTRADGTTVTKVGLANVSFTIAAGAQADALGAQGTLSGGEGAFVVAGGGLAGILSGSFTGSVGPIQAGGNVTVRFNSSGGAVDESIQVGGRTIEISFTEAEGEFFKFSVSGASLNIGDFVTIEGDVSLGSGRFAGANLEVFLGRGPIRLGDGSINPLAVGVLLSDAVVGVRKGVTNTAGYELFATGTLQLVGVDGVTVIGTATIRFNNTGDTDAVEVIAIDGSDTDVSLAVPDGTAVVQALGLEVSIAGQTLRGDFTFTKSGYTLGGSGAVDEGTIVVTAANVSLELGGVVSLTNGAGTLVATAAGIAADLSVDVAVTIPGVSLGAGLRLKINTTGAAVSTNGLVLPAGPYFEISGTSVGLTIAGQTLVGNFALEQVAKPDGSKITRLAVTGAGFDIAGGALVVSGGVGSFLFTPAGVAGELSALVVIGSIGFSSTLEIAVNTTSLAINEAFRVDGVDLRLALPSGPYFRIEARDFDLDVAGQTLHGDFVFEKVVLGGDPTNVAIRIAMANVSLELGGGILVVENGSGSLLIIDDGVNPPGIAGRFAVDIAVAIPGVTLSGGLVVEVNTTTLAVDESFQVGGVGPDARPRSRIVRPGRRPRHQPRPRRSDAHGQLLLRDRRIGRQGRRHRRSSRTGRRSGHRDGRHSAVRREHGRFRRRTVRRRDLGRDPEHHGRRDGERGGQHDRCRGLGRLRCGRDTRCRPGPVRPCRRDRRDRHLRPDTVGHVLDRADHDGIRQGRQGRDRRREHRPGRRHLHVRRDHRCLGWLRHHGRRGRRQAERLGLAHPARLRSGYRRCRVPDQHDRCGCLHDVHGRQPDHRRPVADRRRPAGRPVRPDRGHEPDPVDRRCRHRGRLRLPADDARRWLDDDRRRDRGRRAHRLRSRRGRREWCLRHHRRRDRRRDRRSCSGRRRAGCRAGRPAGPGQHDRGSGRRDRPGRRPHDRDQVRRGRARRLRTLGVEPVAQHRRLRVDLG